MTRLVQRGARLLLFLAGVFVGRHIFYFEEGHGPQYCSLLFSTAQIFFLHRMRADGTALSCNNHGRSPVIRSIVRRD
jgi:hypothetical protein